jgi:hypothetical protein
VRQERDDEERPDDPERLRDAHGRRPWALRKDRWAAVTSPSARVRAESGEEHGRQSCAKGDGTCWKFMLEWCRCRMRLRRPSRSILVIFISRTAFSDRTSPPPSDSSWVY